MIISWAWAFPVVVLVYLVSYVLQTAGLPTKTILYPYILIGLIAPLTAYILYKEIQQGRHKRADVDLETSGDSAPRKARAIAAIKPTIVFGGAVLFAQFVHVLGFTLSVALYSFSMIIAFHRKYLIQKAGACVVLGFSLKWLIVEVIGLRLPSLQILGFVV